MASNVGNVTVTVQLDDSQRERTIAVLEKSKRPHVNCVMTPCTCGADQINAEADALIAELKNDQAVTISKGHQDRFGREVL